MGLRQIMLIFNAEGLNTKTNDGRAVPRLAKEWSVSEDGLNWRFLLRDDVVFHDGSKFNADAAREALARSLARPGARALYPGLADVVDIRAGSEYELLITLKRRSAFLVDDLDIPITKSTQSGSVGTGAFKLLSTSGAETVMEAHDKYHQGPPKIDRLIIRPYKTLRTAWASLMRQEMDVLWDVAHDSTEFVGSTEIAFHSYVRRYVYVIAFNSARPQFQPSGVRRALNAAVDRNALIRDVLKGHGIAANGPLWPTHWAYDRTVPGYAFDPYLAATTLDAAGRKRPAAKPGQVPTRFSFTCVVPENFALQERLTLYVQKQLYDIGVDMQLEAVSAEEYNKRVPAGDFDAVFIDMVSGPVFTRPYSFWRWGGEPTPWNTFGYRNPTADRWFDALRYSTNDAEYRAATAQLQRVLLEDPPALFLAWNERTRAISRRFAVPVEQGRDPMSNVWQWTPQAAPASGTH